MISKKMEELGKHSSVIRELFEYGNKRRAEIGKENVYDFSLGNPSIPSPQAVKDTMLKLLNEKDPVSLHGYTSAPGDYGVRSTIASSIRDNYGIDARPERIYMTCGAAASLTVSLHALCNPGDEVIALAPFFPEYRVFVEKAGAALVMVPCREPDFQIDFAALEPAVTAKTKAVIINSPNNPTGAVYSEETIRTLADLLNRKQKEFGTEIYLLTDEPYRELAFGGIEVPYVPCYYDNTLVCYSYSKSLSLPGERIGYIFVAPGVKDGGDVFAAVCGAGRALGFVCAPSMLQYTVGACNGMTSDVAAYERNRDILYGALTEIGYTITPPDGAFYLFVKALEPDAGAFSERAKKHELLLVPSDSFGYPGYVRIAYCVTEQMIRDSIPAFRALYEEYAGERE